LEKYLRTPTRVSVRSKRPHATARIGFLISTISGDAPKHLVGFGRWALDYADMDSVKDNWKVPTR
jgi:hypothetical protein